MARRKGGFGKFVGSITGSPYERLLRQIEKITNETDDRQLPRALDDLAKQIRSHHDEENIDEEEHDLLLEEIEDIHPKGKMYAKLVADEDEFYVGDMPDAPEMEAGKKVNLDDLMRSQTDSFKSSYGRDEYDEYRQKMADDFFRESDDALASGDHSHLQARDPSGRVFNDVELEADRVKQQIYDEMRAEKGDKDETPEAADEDEDKDEDYRVDEDGVEWWRDDDGAWWYRPADEDDWFPYK
jgi:hypothetical protein